ncbi:MAG TPA: hypothetical protein PL151_19280 [Phycisphaerae bacterium]|nr:hypothetical protein [Phycisphaerae bacterium]HOJ73872.1 hypothetical protein [Phycisphaerae bacterium]HOM50813.1 hypothetical protein [Phycisphaerae bacterium]HON65563.1 hypothetical protein [Phycisphaerae bacterium]HOQ88047.1 hypothetical protein [Phycisphaerae bacterium]
MSRRWLSLILATSLLAWASGFLLDLHLHHEGEEHDSQHCDVCLVLLAGCRAVVDEPDSVALAEPVQWPAAPASVQAAPARYVDRAIAPRAPPVG